MIKIDDAFQHGKAFIPYITAGYPDLQTTATYIKTMANQGADLIEIGIPFSDPTAEGPVIQHAIHHALKQGIRTDDVFDMVAQVRQDVNIPLAVMTYANVCYGYGLDQFMQRCHEVGIQAVVLPDVPFEEKDEFQSAAQAHQVSLISFIAPTSQERIEKIAKEAEGFIYLVSSLGVTGTRQDIETDVGAIIAQIRQANPDIPIAIGFGISNPDQAQQMGQVADGIIVGSAIIKLIDRYGQDGQAAIGQFVKEMKAAANV